MGLGGMQVGHRIWRLPLYRLVLEGQHAEGGVGEVWAAVCRTAIYWSVGWSGRVGVRACGQCGETAAGRGRPGVRLSVVLSSGRVQESGLDRCFFGADVVWVWDLGSRTGQVSAGRNTARPYGVGWDGGGLGKEEWRTVRESQQRSTTGCRGGGGEGWGVALKRHEQASNEEDF